jgi:hypothetical protein
MCAVTTSVHSSSTPSPSTASPDPTYRRIWDVPRALHAARAGDPGALDAFLAAARHYQRDTPANALDQGLHATALCADWRFPWGDSTAPLAGRAVALRRSVDRLSAAALSPFDASTAAGNGFVRQCLPWAPPRQRPCRTGGSACRPCS